MMRRALAAVLVVATGASTALAAPGGAGPVDPYAPPPTKPAAPGAPVPPAPDATMDDATKATLALDLMAQADALYAASRYAEARQLATEVLALVSTGEVAQRAQELILSADTMLRPPPQRPQPPPIDLQPPTEPTDPYAQPEPPQPELPQPRGPRVGGPAAAIYGGLIGSVFGATFGSIATDDDSDTEVVAGALGAAVGATLVVRWSRATKLDADQVPTIGAGAVWGGTIAGFLTDAVTGIDETTPRQALIGTTIGTLLGGWGASRLAQRHRFTTDDVALIDGAAGLGNLAGLMLGVAMDPPTGEAYSLNAAIGTAAGVAVGAWASRRVHATPLRVAKVTAIALAGAVLPWLLYAASNPDDDSSAEQLVGLASTAGLVGGTYLGWRITY